MADPTRTKARSRGRARTTPSMAAAAAGGPPPQMPPPQQAPPPSGAGRAMTRPPGPPPGQTRPYKPGPAGDAASLSAQMASVSLKDSEGPSMGRGGMRGRRELVAPVRTRPDAVDSKCGSTGDVVRLQSNYFKLIDHTDWCLYQYRVDFDPPEDNTFLRKKLFFIHEKKFGGYIFDGCTMFCNHRIHGDEVELYSERESDQTKFRITVKKVADLVVGDVAYLQVFNILIRNCLRHLELQLVGRDYYDAKMKVDVPEFHLQMWPGYITSIAQHEESILMNCEVTHKVMRLETALDVLHECCNRDSHGWKILFTSAIVGTTVLTDYNNRTYRIDDVKYEETPASTFPLKTGEKISFIDYYKKKYGINIRRKDQPLLISQTNARERRSGEKETVSLVPELCRVTGITDEMRNNVHLMKSIAVHTRIAPGVRIQKILKFLSRLKGNTKCVDEMRKWNLELSNNLVEFPGRILPQEKIILGNGGVTSAGPEADWTRNLRGNHLLYAPKMQWILIAPERARNDVMNFIPTLIKASQGINYQVARPKLEIIPDDRTGTYVEALDRAANMNPDLIMCVVPNARADRYSAIKKRSCVDRAVPTQVVLVKILNSKGVMSIATKIAIQMNCKVGGAPWAIELPIKGLMVIGFDVSRDSYNRDRSFGAMVASLNNTYSRYYSAVSAHVSGEELSDHISAHLVNACLQYRTCNGTLPEKMIFFRDGVGAGQIEYVFKHELQNIKGKLVELYGGMEPKMAFVIVTKRINTRLFLNGENPPPGTLADQCVTSPEKYDFFLVSQHVKQGTVSPTSYNVIYDTCMLPPDRMQRLAYKMTHLYYNWSGTVRVPAPCQYAHKLSFLVGQAIHKVPHASLCDRLYFL